MRQTSIKAFHAVSASGVISARRKQAYQYLYDHGPLTGSELCKIAGVPGLWKRLSELRRMKLVMEIGERICTISNQKCIEWDVTANMPPTKVAAADEDAEDEAEEITLWLLKADGKAAHGYSTEATARKKVSVYAAQVKVEKSQVKLFKAICTEHPI
jgi:hypothetical protein